MKITTAYELRAFILKLGWYIELVGYLASGINKLAPLMYIFLFVCWLADDFWLLNLLRNCSNPKEFWGRNYVLGVGVFIFLDAFGIFKINSFCPLWYIIRELLKSSFFCIKAVCSKLFVEKLQGFKVFQKWVIESQWVICYLFSLVKGAFALLINPLQDARHIIRESIHGHIVKIRTIVMLEI